jgi:RNA polymerase sigma factor for flagellar operon FliA
MSHALKSARAVRKSASESSTQLPQERRRGPRSAPSFANRRFQKLAMGMTKAELIENYRYKVRLIAVKLARELPPSTDVDDLISTGFIGLMDAAEKFDPTRGVKFDTYAEFRIRGSILDELRKLDWVSRNARDQINLMRTLKDKMEAVNGVRPSQSEMSQHLQMPLEKFQEIVRDLGSLALIGFEDLQDGFEPEDEWANPFREAVRKELKAIVDRLLETVSEQERMVLNCYYYRGLNLREVSEILDVSESRVSQIHTEAVKNLRRLIRSKNTPIETLFIALIDE